MITMITMITLVAKKTHDNKTGVGTRTIKGYSSFASRGGLAGKLHHLHLFDIFQVVIMFCISSSHIVINVHSYF